MSATRKTGPRVAGPITSTGPRVASAQPSTPPTNVQLGNDRLLVGAREVDIAQLAPDPTQPRKHMHPDRLAELARSIAQYGILQPLVVRQEGLGRDGDMRYTIVAGGRRYAAVRLAISGAGSDDERRRLARVPVVVTETKAAEQRVLQLIENLQREDLDPIEEARALKEVMRIEKLTTDGVAARVQRSQGYVDERLRLLRYEDVEEAVESGLLSKSAAAAIASIRMTEARLAWLERARLGETIRAREVYASKTDRRASGRRREIALPNFGNTSSSEAARGNPGQAPTNGRGILGDFRAAPGRATGDHDVVPLPPTSVASEGRTGSLLAADVSSSLEQHTSTQELRLGTGGAQAIARLQELGVALPPDIAAILAQSQVAWPSVLQALAKSASAGERAYGERLLAIGAVQRMSCEGLLTILKG